MGTYLGQGRGCTQRGHNLDRFWWAAPSQKEIAANALVLQDVLGIPMTTMLRLIRELCLAQIFRAGLTGQEGHLPGWLASQGTGAGRGRGRPLLHETLLLGSRNALLRTTEHAETQKIAIWRPRPGDPLTRSHFGPPDSIRRRVGRPLSRGGGLAQIFRAAHMGRKAIYQAGLHQSRGALPKGLPLPARG